MVTNSQIRKSNILILIAFLFVGCSNYDEIVTISTEYGSMKVVLYDETPSHKKSFLKLAKSGKYDSTSFHRVINNFMIQAGDMGEKKGLEAEANYLIEEEINRNLLHERGAIGAATRNPKRNSSTQFYIVQGRAYSPLEVLTDIEKLNKASTYFLNSERNEKLREEFDTLYIQGKMEELQNRILGLKDNIEEYIGYSLDNKRLTQKEFDTYTTIGGAPHLDGLYTVFGKVVEGLDIVDKIAAVETDTNDIPIKKILVKMSVEEILKKEITQKYGIEY